MKTQSNHGGKNIALVILQNLGWPLLWGMSAWVGFYVLIHQGIISNEFIRRYLASHPVEYIETAMFFIALAALVIKAMEVSRQYVGLSQIKLSPASSAGQETEDCPTLLGELHDMPSALQDSYLVRRLREALQFVHRNKAAEGLDEELKYLSDLDAGRLQEGYALIRLVIWAIPILGFLGTVIGITLALSNLSPEALEESMGGLTSAMSVAFDTTAVALSFSIVLMFSQFLIEQVETELLTAVDSLATAELAGRFQVAGSDPQLASIRRMSEAVVQATEKLVHRQADIWQNTITSAHDRWNQLVVSAGQQLEDSLSSSLEKTLNAHASKLLHSEESSGKRTRRLVEQFGKSLEKNAELLQAQQKEMHKQAEVMFRAIEASGEVNTLQQSLNDNLKSLAGAKNFEDTVMSLAAAIHLLNTRLQPTVTTNDVQLEQAPTSDSQGRAA